MTLSKIRGGTAHGSEKYCTHITTGDINNLGLGHGACYAIGDGGGAI